MSCSLPMQTERQFSILQERTHSMVQRLFPELTNHNALQSKRYFLGETTHMTSIADKLERLAALCRRSFGPCGEETLLFRPAEAPVVTGEGHAVLAAWKQGLDGEDPLATFLLSAANGVHKQLGDGSSEFILLVDAAVRKADEGLRRQHDARSGVDRARLSRAFAELKWELQEEIQTSLSNLKIPVSVEINPETLQPSTMFRESSVNILKSGLRGVLGEQAVEFISELILEWIFALPTSAALDGAERIDKVLFSRVQQLLKCAPDAIIFMAGPSVRSSYVVPRGDFILKKSVVTSQPPGILDQSSGQIRFVCFLCALSMTEGSNQIEFAANTYEELFSAQDASNLFISRFVRHLREREGLQIVISTEALDESVIAACTRQGIACVQLAEPEDVESLCMHAGIFPLASVFDEITPNHTGICTKGISKVRFQQQACLRLRGLVRSNQRRDIKQDSEHEQHSIVVPQLLVQAPTKGVYKLYYAAIVKCLRVLRSWFESPTTSTEDRALQPAILYCCRGGGATELAIARWLQDGSSPSSSATRDAAMHSLAKQILAGALLEVVSTLRNNLGTTCSNARDDGAASGGNQRLVLLEAFSNLSLKDEQSNPKGYSGYAVDYSRVLQTTVGPIQMPELVIGDPAECGLLHPWKRIDTLLFLTLQTLEQLFRIDRVS